MFPHEQYMARCIELAQLGIRSVSPNPMVGSVIVNAGQVIGEGYHEEFGGSHAEVNAINNALANHVDANTLFKNSTIYVSMEPCSHFGKTPPCADLIIRHQIPRVVIGCRDPFGHVNGKGISKLKEAGVEVIEGILKDRCRDLNRRFFTRIEKQRPYIILKWAQTQDKFFAPPGNVQRWISSDLSRQLVHRWRSEEDAVLVGKNTALADNPRLNVREWTGKNPVRIIIDKNLELPSDLHIFDQSQDTIIFNASKTYADGKIKYLELEDFSNLLAPLICYQLYLMDVQSVIVEGGARTLDLFITAGLWDEARVFTTPVNWTDGLPAPVLPRQAVSSVAIGPDQLEIWKNDK